MSSIERWALALIILVVILAIGAWPRWQRHSQLAEAASQLKNAPPTVIVVHPKGEEDNGVILPGTMIASKEVEVNARGAGYVAHYYADIGSVVRAGQVLADIQAPDVDAQYKQAKAQTEQSQATLGQAQAQAIGLRAQVLQAQAQDESTAALLLQAQATANSYRDKVTEAEKAYRQAVANRRYDISTLALDQKEWDRYKWLDDQGFATDEQADQQKAAYVSQQAKVDADTESMRTAAATVEDAKASWKAQVAAVHSAQSNLRAAQENISAATANLASGQDNVWANQAGVQANQYNEKRFGVLSGFEKVVAPFDGVITARNVDEGSLVNPPTTNVSDTDPTNTAPKTGLFAMARLNPMMIQVYLPQTFVAGIRIGDPADIFVRELPGRKFPGKVVALAGALDTTSRTQQMRVSVANPIGRLRPGMYADVQLKGMHQKAVLHVPATALMFDAQGTRLAVVSANDTVHMQPVTVGRDFGSEVEILNGLKGGEQVVQTPGDNLQEGLKVRPVLPQQAATTSSSNGTRKPGGSAQ